MTYNNGQNWDKIVNNQIAQEEGNERYGKKGRYSAFKSKKLGKRYSASYDNLAS